MKLNQQPYAQALSQARLECPYQRREKCLELPVRTSSLNQVNFRGNRLILSVAISLKHGIIRMQNHQFPWNGTWDPRQERGARMGCFSHPAGLERILYAHRERFPFEKRRRY